MGNIYLNNKGFLHPLMKCGYLKSNFGDFPGGPAAKTLHSQCRALGLIPGQGTRSHMPQVSVQRLQLKISYATTKKTECSQINTFKNNNKAQQCR